MKAMLKAIDPQAPMRLDFKCRPIIRLDGCFLKGCHVGYILAAVGRGPNHEILAIILLLLRVKTKTLDLFLNLLIDDLGGPSYTLISDQQKV